MANIIAVTGCPTGIAHTIMATEALKKTALVMGHEIKIETQGAEGVQNPLTDADIAAADTVIISSDIFVNVKRFAGKPMVAVSTSAAIGKTQSIIEEALAEMEKTSPNTEEQTAPVQTLPPVVKRLVGVTSCPTGIAHTFMAAEALRKAAKTLGYEIKVETQGSVGAKNILTCEEIEDADAVIIAADAHVDTRRFAGKRVYETSTKEALHNAVTLIQAALAQSSPRKIDYKGKIKQFKKEHSTTRTGPYKHLMTGVSYMLPMVIAGGILIALAFAFGGIYAGDAKGSLGWALMQIGGATAFTLYVPVLAGFIAYSIADRPGITPGLVGGMLAMTVGSGFLGGILAGFIAGYLTRFLNNKINLPDNLQGLKPVLILPVLSTLVVGLLMIYIVGPPVKIALNSLETWLIGLQQGSALILGLILGAMMAFDMGGPVNKAAYTFSVGLLASKIYMPMAAVMAAGMVPPLGLALAATLFKSRFTIDEREAGKAAYVLGISFITEGAIPYAARDPFRVIPCIMVGSAVTGALSMVFDVNLLVPHGGVFVLFIPNAVTHLLNYIFAIAAGTLISAGLLFIVKKPLAKADGPLADDRSEQVPV
ncbi:MAG: PTS fructose-like transporter subunit IIB [Desulfobacteraceae bacterium]|nr:PTS fructose-like transporter subunit IIB [Desulfobacteraceae bacterium]